jgi:hypothetical protein
MCLETSGDYALGGGVGGKTIGGAGFASRASIVAATGAKTIAATIGGANVAGVTEKMRDEADLSENRSHLQACFSAAW